MECGRSLEETSKELVRVMKDTPKAEATRRNQSGLCVLTTGVLLKSGAVRTKPLVVCWFLPAVPPAVCNPHK